MPAERKLDGKVAIVTGAGRGIGRGISKALAAAGAKVVLASRSPEPLERTAGEIRALGGEALPLVCDVGDEQQVKHVVSGTIDAYGRLDIVVNNAQSWGPPGERVIVPPFTPLHELPEEWWDNTFQTGVKAVFYFCKAAFPYLKERGGKVINIGSAGGTVGTPFLGDFSANKEAIRGLSKSLAREWGTYEIQVNVICPLIATEPLEQSVAGGSATEKKVHPVPAGRLGDADRDAGPLAVFLASSDSDYLTGQTFMLDGGLTIG
jgi:NAD(P)-dependent dehydrogenase (short-subunit alcohol dehydrogenase family)